MQRRGESMGGEDVSRKSRLLLIVGGLVGILIVGAVVVLGVGILRSSAANPYEKLAEQELQNRKSATRPEKGEDAAAAPSSLPPKPVAPLPPAPKLQAPPPPPPVKPAPPPPPPP